MNEATGLGSKWPRVSQTDVALYARRARVMDGERIDSATKMVEQHLAHFGLRQITQDHRIFQVNGRVEQVVAHKRPDLGVELVVAADEAKVFQ